MSKHYVVNCYTCQHNGQETCKGCRTLLVGEDEPYENWQLREDLETEDQTITDLEAKLAEKDLRIEELESQFAYECECNKQFVECQNENTQLKQQLAEKIQKYQMTDDNYARLNEKYDLLESRHELLLEENLKLEQQLAEKEKEIEGLKAQRRIYLNRSVEECNKITDLEFELQHKDQDKISFAVEQLTEIREYVKECWGLDELEGKVRLDIAKKIRLKIEQLKEGK